MENIEKNCLQGLKRPSKLLENMMCRRKILFIEVRETCSLLMKKQKFQN